MDYKFKAIGSALNLVHTDDSVDLDKLTASLVQKCMHQHGDIERGPKTVVLSSLQSPIE